MLPYSTYSAAIIFLWSMSDESSFIYQHKTFQAIGKTRDHQRPQTTETKRQQLEC